MRIKIILLLFTFISFFSAAQTKTTVPLKKPVSNQAKPISADCSIPIPITINVSTTYGPTVPPNEFGLVKEIDGRQKNAFEEEHNSAWYLLSISKDGELGFEIVPVDTLNDYDFIIYNYTDSTFCDKLQKNKLQPIRSNLANIKRSVKGITGLQPDANAISIGKGIGNAYSKTIEVKKGEKYMLVLDNVHPEGKGHTIFFSYLKNIELKGKVVGADSIPLIADIILSDNKGRTVEETQSNAQGEYKINTQIKENQNYNLTFTSENTFVQTATINTKDLKGTAVFTDIKVVLPKLKKGDKYKLGNINFFGDQAILLPESYPSVEALYKLMKKNKNMVIQIEGHTNGDDWNLPIQKQSPREKILSDDRALTVYNRLIQKGIDKNRMRTAGFGSTVPIVKHAQEPEATLNRRVEIKIVTIE